MMNDAISRNALYDEIRYGLQLDSWCRVSEVDVLLRIKHAPSLDVEPVVYCKDCSHARPLNFRELMVFDSGCFVCTSQHGAGTSYPEYEMTGKVVFPKSFCSYAHRRTNGR